MKFGLVAVIAALSLGFAHGQKAALRATDINLMQFMMQSRDVSQENPQRSLSCFGYYVPILQAITDQYQENYEACLNKADLERQGLDNSTQPQRNQIESSSKNSCELLYSCSQEDSSIPFFECIVDAGSENTKTMYEISANASEILADVRVQIILIENNEYKCTNQSERIYVEDTNKAYEELQSCVKGESPVPSNPPSSSTSTTVIVPETTEDSAALPQSESRLGSENGNGDHPVKKLSHDVFNKFRKFF